MNPVKSQHEILTMKELCDLLQVHQSTIYKMLKPWSRHSVKCPAWPDIPVKRILPCFLGRLGELVPLGVLEPRDIVDRMIEVDVNVVGLEAAQAALERLASSLLLSSVRFHARVFDVRNTLSRLPRSARPRVVSRIATPVRFRRRRNS